VADDKLHNRDHAALLLIDVINDFASVPDLARQAQPAAETIKELCAEARAFGVPIVYVNDNFALWHSERAQIVEHCRGPDSHGRAIVDLLTPEAADYFVIKPRYSGFYATSLPVLLPQLGATRLILTGFATDICVLFTATDAYMRDYDLWIPADCVAAATPGRSRAALDHMAEILKADTRASGELKLADWLRSKKN
jgi:nicotinamidase-related amidase